MGWFPVRKVLALPPALLPSRDQLLQVNPHDGSHRVGVRAGISILVPLVVVLAIGHPEWAPYASFGAFPSLYGRQLPWLTRVQMQASAAFTITLAVVTGALVSMASVNHAITQVVFAAVIASTGEVFAKAHSYHPRGPMFMVFAYGAISSIPHRWSDMTAVVVVTALSAVFAVLVGVVGVLRDPGGLREQLHRTGWLKLSYRPDWNPVWMALAVVVAGSLGWGLGIGRPYWGMVAAVAPLTAPHVTTQMTRAIHRSIGTIGGLLTAGLLLAGRPPAWVLVLAVAALQIGTEMWVGRNYAIAMLMVTPMALAMGQLGHAQPVGQLLADRGVETLIGSAVGVLVALLSHHLRGVHHARVGYTKHPHDSSGH